MSPSKAILPLGWKDAINFSIFSLGKKMPGIAQAVSDSSTKRRGALTLPRSVANHHRNPTLPFKCKLLESEIVPTVNHR